MYTSTYSRNMLKTDDKSGNVVVTTTQTSTYAIQATNWLYDTTTTTKCAQHNNSLIKPTKKYTIELTRINGEYDWPEHFSHVTIFRHKNRAERLHFGVRPTRHVSLYEISHFCGLRCLVEQFFKCFVVNDAFLEQVRENVIRVCCVLAYVVMVLLQYLAVDVR